MPGLTKIKDSSLLGLVNGTLAWLAIVKFFVSVSVMGAC